VNFSKDSVPRVVARTALDAMRNLKMSFFLVNEYCLGATGYIERHLDRSGNWTCSDYVLRRFARLLYRMRSDISASAYASAKMRIR